MARFLHRVYSCRCTDPAAASLSVFWICGILFGIWAGAVSGGHPVSLMRSAPYAAVSIVSLVLITFFPFLLSALAVSIFGRWLICPIAWCKGLLFSFVAMGIFRCYGCAGWLIRLFLCFSDMVSLPLLYLFWLRLLDRVHSAGFRDWFLWLAPVFCIASIDFCLIIPYFADLINL